jgi:hypothetical protein
MITITNGELVKGRNENMTLLLTNSLYFLVIVFHLVAVPDFCVGFECKHENTDLSALNG